MLIFKDKKFGRLSELLKSVINHSLLAWPLCKLQEKWRQQRWRLCTYSLVSLCGVFVPLLPCFFIFSSPSPVVLGTHWHSKVRRTKRAFASAGGISGPQAPTMASCGAPCYVWSSHCHGHQHSSDPTLLPLLHGEGPGMSPLPSPSGVGAAGDAHSSQPGLAKSRLWMSQLSRVPSGCRVKWAKLDSAPERRAHSKGR